MLQRGTASAPGAGNERAITRQRINPDNGPCAAGRHKNFSAGSEHQIVRAIQRGSAANSDAREQHTIPGERADFENPAGVKAGQQNITLGIQCHAPNQRTEIHSAATNADLRDDAAFASDGVGPQHRIVRATSGTVLGEDNLAERQTRGAAV